MRWYAERWFRCARFDRADRAAPPAALSQLRKIDTHFRWSERGGESLGTVSG